jgi:hypothetical protein
MVNEHHLEKEQMAIAIDNVIEGYGMQNDSRAISSTIHFMPQ